MNYFFALELPENVRKEVAKAASEWQVLVKPPSRAKWLEPEDYHLTLAFLGDLPRSAEEKLVEIATPIAAATTNFEVQLLSFDAFESLTWPRVLYISVQPNAARIELTKQLYSQLKDQEYKLDQRPPRPHVTVARNCLSKVRLSWPGWPAPSERLFPGWEVSQFVLMQTLPPSQRVNGAKSRYNIVHTFSFGNTHS